MTEENVHWSQIEEGKQALLKLINETLGPFDPGPFCKEGESGEDNISIKVPTGSANVRRSPPTSFLRIDSDGNTWIEVKVGPNESEPFYREEGIFKIIDERIQWWNQYLPEHLLVEISNLIVKYLNEKRAEHG